MVDCGDCGSAGSVRRGFCEVCYANPGELRFADVIAELGAIATLATSLGDGEMLAAACRRAERLLHALKQQFHGDLGLGTKGNTGGTFISRSPSGRGPVKAPA